MWLLKSSQDEFIFILRTLNGNSRYGKRKRSEMKEKRERERGKSKQQQKMLYVKALKVVHERYSFSLPCALKILRTIFFLLVIFYLSVEYLHSFEIKKKFLGPPMKI